jgi:NHLM bacteriocin system ABC transporter ATP-binding protein
MGLANRLQNPDDVSRGELAPLPTGRDVIDSLFAGAEAVEAGGDRPFLLAGNDLWLVQSGQVEVFTVRQDGGEPVGPRRHLLPVGQGQVLFGAGQACSLEHWGLLAVGGTGTRLLRQRRPGRPAGSAAESGSEDFLGLVEPWVQALYSAITHDKPPSISVELENGAEVEVGSATNVRARAELAWVRHLDGHSRLLGRKGLELSVDGFLPIARRAWLEAREPTRLLALDGRALPGPEELWAGLERLHGLVLRYAEVMERETHAVSVVRTRQRAGLREAVLRDACERLATTMTPGAHLHGSAVTPGDDVAVEDLEDPLFAACNLVGRALDLKIRSYPRVQGSPPPHDPLAATLHASRVRSRTVVLRGRWWCEDQGPLLAYCSVDKRPVALLRSTDHKGYTLHDPGSHISQRVDAAVAEQLEPQARTFYRPFKERRLGVRDVVAFGLYGCRRDLALLVGVSLCAALLGMVPPLATGMLFNTVIPGAQRPQLLQLTFVLVACAVATALFNLAQGIALLRVEGRASGAIQAAVWDRLLGLPLSFFRPYTSGELAVRAMSIDAIRQVISGSTAATIMGGIVSIGNFSLMFWYSWKMALWATALMAVAIGVTVAGSFLQLRPQREAMRLQSKSAGVVLQLLSSIGKIRVAGVEVAAFALWVRRFSEQRRLQYRVRAVANWVSAFNAAVPVASYAVIFYLAVPLVTETHTLATGDFLAFLAAFSTCTTSLIGTSLALLATLNTIPLYEQAQPILETIPEVDSGKADPGALTGEIEVHHAMFRYQQDGALVLRDVSFRVAPGEFVAFVGPSGSGKSTLLRLLLGFETLESGAIYYDGQEIGGLDVQALRRQMGVVLQSGRLMSGDIYSNIAGSAAASLDDAWTAARMAGLADDIAAMPMGMHTVVSEGGGTLSGGQRQRLLIARAIVSRPQILLFDEATSALDNRTQATVSASLERLQATRIVVAHRLSTIVNADRIFVLERGRLVQSGRFEALMAETGPFADLAKRQIA